MKLQRSIIAKRSLWRKAKKPRTEKKESQSTNHRQQFRRFRRIRYSITTFSTCFLSERHAFRHAPIQHLFH
ncbi:unnamed protein product [Haemonchus placei]|uniref:Ovule protein n=1 Tax=Haemonchus placei TaxID=6290 RepID=A0A0N4VYQ4_HAEPC|nr:unnamed protein product [Haemonchus placei]